MKNEKNFFLRRSTVTVAFGILAVVAAAHSSREAPAAISGVPDDWTHHRLIFSNPGTAEDAIKHGTYDRWLAITKNPRYVQQQTKRSSMNTAAPATWIHSPEAEVEPQFIEREPVVPAPPIETSRLPRGLYKAPSYPRMLPRPGRERRPAAPQVHTDWSEYLGSSASAGLGVFPAKYSFSTGSANCANSATPDYVVYNTGVAGSGTQASIIAFDNLYTGCTSGTVPTVYWAYNTNGGAITTSVVLSGNGTQVAFAQSVAGVASLVVLKWSGATGGSAGAPDTLSNTAAGSYFNCPAPCMTTVTFSNNANDSGSAPFYDYSTDTIYIGDDTGKLHKFTGVFTGTPTEATGSWPVTVSKSALGGPVYDSGSGNILVGDYLANSSSTCALSGNPCGYFYSVKASSAAVVGKTTNALDYVSGIVDSPLVDSVAGMAYVFVGADSESGVTSACGTDIPCAGVFQFPVSFTSGNGTEATIGPGYEFVLSGAFDNAYYTSANSSSPTGHLYVVGSTGAANNTLYQISISSNAMSTSSTAGPTVSDSYTTGGYFSAGLQVTEFLNGAHDYIFLSVLSYGLPTGCTSSITEGCVMGFDVTSGSISGSTSPTAAATEAGGTSGIIIDNSAALSGAANIYFTTLLSQACTTSGGTGGCAIQTLQSAP